MTTATSAGEPAVSFGPLALPRFGRPSTPLAIYLWLVLALVDRWGPPARAIARIAVTRQLIRSAGDVFPRMLRITVILAHLAGEAAAEAEKMLVNARRAVRRAVGAPIWWLVASMTTAFPGTVVALRVPPHRSTPHRGHRSGRSGSNRSRNPELARGNGSPPATWAKSLRQSGNRDLKITKPAGS